MSKSKMANRQKLDPNSVRPEAKNLSVLPGSPHTMDPNNVNRASGVPIQADSIYNDFRQNYPQMGSTILDPVRVTPSQMSPIPNNPQPNKDFADAMEASRQKETAAKYGVIANEMGPAGSGVNTPGAFPANAPFTTGGVFLPPMATLDPKTPGATPQKIGQKKGNKGTA
jgi:hypothetical protein